MPFCPKCKSEYREGYTICADCKVPLVDKPSESEEETMPIGGPTEVRESELKYITVFISDEVKEATRVKQILNENKIPYITKGDETEEFHYVDFLVREDKFKEAQNLLKDIIKQESEGIEQTSNLELNREEDAGEDLTPQDRAKGIATGFLLLGIVAVSALPGIKNQDKLWAAGILVTVFTIVFFGFLRDKRI